MKKSYRTVRSEPFLDVLGYTSDLKQCNKNNFNPKDRSRIQNTTGDATTNDGSVFKAVVVPAPDAQWHRLHRNRASLVLVDGVVFVGFSSLCEGNRTRMHGSISAFDAATLEPVGRFQVTPDTDGGGVWQGSTGLAADTRGNLYFTTGNRRICGAVPDGETATADRRSLSSSVIRVRIERRPAQGSEPYHLEMEAADYFTPYRPVMEDCYDLDLSAAGVLLIPGTPYLGTGGKEGVFYVLDRADMGGYDYAGPAGTATLSTVPARA
jgi:hypothetical protein